MSNGFFKRPWVTALTALTFVAVAVSGVLMVFHVGVPFIKDLHELMGIAFALVGIMHLIMNRKNLTAYFRNRSAVIALLAGILFCAALLLFGSKESGPERGGPHGRVINESGDISENVR